MDRMRPSTEKAHILKAMGWGALVMLLAAGCPQNAVPLAAPPRAKAPRPIRTADGISRFVPRAGRQPSPRGPGNESAVQPESFAAEGGDHDPDVSADGRWLVFASTRHGRRPDLYIKRINAATVTRLTDTPRHGEYTPRFSPDNRRIAFAGNRDGNLDLYVIDRARARNEQPLTETRLTDEYAPAWHPTRGEIIAYCALPRRPGAEWEVRVLNTRKRGYTAIGKGIFPRWSPDGSKLVFQRAREREPRLYSIWTVDVSLDAEGNLDYTNLTAVVSSASWAAINPSFSPDGRMIAFSTVARGAGATAGGPQYWRGEDVWVVRADGVGKIKLTADPNPDYSPVWAAQAGSPGRNGRIYFTSLRTGHKNIWSLDPFPRLNRRRTRTRR